MVALNFTVHRSTGVVHTVLGGVGPEDDFDPARVRGSGGREGSASHRVALQTGEPQLPAGRHGHSDQDVEIGGASVVAMAGPAVSRARSDRTRPREVVAKAGAKVIRGGAFKPRSSPYSFQGLGEEGLKLLRDAADRHDLLVVSEVMDQTQIPLHARLRRHLPGRRAQHAEFQPAAGAWQSRKPVLLKRGIAATIEELLLSAEYLLSGGNYDVILCERGIRTFETYTRNTMDISAIPVVKKLSHLPIVARSVARHRPARPGAADGARRRCRGRRRTASSKFITIPIRRYRDGAQSLRPEQFDELMSQLRIIASAVGRTV